MICDFCEQREATKLLFSVIPPGELEVRLWPPEGRCDECMGLLRGVIICSTIPVDQRIHADDCVAVVESS